MFRQDLTKVAAVQYIIGCTLAIMFTGCACTDTRSPQAKRANSKNQEIALVGASDARQTAISAVAYIKSVQEGSGVQGKVMFLTVPEGVKVVADIDGLTPGEHGFHIHEHGDCGGKDAAAAGAHFNPTHKPHGGPDSPSRHVGDLGNLVADKNGHAHYERIDKVITLEGKDSIIGRSIIVHADKDDFKTQPAGASGAKIACGIISEIP